MFKNRRCSAFRHQVPVTIDKCVSVWCVCGRVGEKTGENTLEQKVTTLALIQRSSPEFQDGEQGTSCTDIISLAVKLFVGQEHRTITEQLIGMGITDLKLWPTFVVSRRSFVGSGRLLLFETKENKNDKQFFLIFRFIYCGEEAEL